MASQEFKTALVDKPIPVSADYGNLAVFDTNPLDAQALSGEQKEEHLTEVARENVQTLVNQLLQLPLRKTTESNNSSSTQDSTMVLISLPEPVTELPREKPLPKTKEPTKWEQFAAKKGITKKAKDGKLVFDEATAKWVPKWGYGGINKKLDDQWLVEVDEVKTKNKKRKGQEDELIDPRTLNRDERKRLVKKNQVQQQRNAKRAMAK